MLISTVLLLDKCQTGLRSGDAEVYTAAVSCMAYLVYHLSESVIVLPDHIAQKYIKLPEGTVYAASNS